MIIRFEDLELDLSLVELRRSGVRVPVEPKVFDVLAYLIEHRERVVPKEELMDTVWGGRFVSEAAVTSRIKQARQAIGDDGHAQRLIRTVHGHGYRFVGSLREARRHTPPSPPRRHQPVRYAVSDGLQIAYQVTGRGVRDIVLVAGFVSHLELDWADPRHAAFLDRLGSFGRLIRFDKRGTGMSDRPVDLPDMETRMHDVLAVMDAAGSERAVLFGYSEGGPMSILMAAMHPERVEALVLYGTYARRLRADDYPWAHTPEERAQYMERLAVEWSWEADMRAMCPSADDAMARWWGQRARAAATPSTVRSLIAMNSLIDVRTALGSVRVPTLVMHRRGDQDSRVEEGRYLAERIPGARFVELPGADHFVAVDSNQILDPLEQFLADLGSGAATTARTRRRPGRRRTRRPRRIRFRGPRGAHPGRADGRRVRRPGRGDPRRAIRPGRSARQGYAVRAADRRGATDRAGGRRPGRRGRPEPCRPGGAGSAARVTGRPRPRRRLRPVVGARRRRRIPARHAVARPLVRCRDELVVPDPGLPE